MRALSRRAFTGLAVVSGASIASLLTGTRGLGSLASAADAPPAPQALIALMILHATNGPAPGLIDARVDDGKPALPAEDLPSHKLRHPPLSAYNTYVLKDRKRVTLTKGTPSRVLLPNGRTLELTLVDLKDKRHRATVATAINEAPGSDVFKNLIEFTESPHQSVFVGGIGVGTAFPTGSIVVAFTFE